MARNEKQKMLDRLDSIDKTLIEQHVTLKEHIRRTELLEERMHPVETAVSMAKGAIKLVTLVGVAVSIAEGIRMIWLK